MSYLKKTNGKINSKGTGKGKGMKGNGKVDTAEEAGGDSWEELAEEADAGAVFDYDDDMDQVCGCVAEDSDDDTWLLGGYSRLSGLRSHGLKLPAKVQNTSAW